MHAGKAVVFILAALGHRRTARLLAAWPLLPCLELGYRAVAANRGQLAR